MFFVRFADVNNVPLKYVVSRLEQKAGSLEGKPAFVFSLYPLSDFNANFIAWI